MILLFWIWLLVAVVAFVILVKSQYYKDPWYTNIGMVVMALFWPMLAMGLALEKAVDLYSTIMDDFEADKADEE